MNKETYVMCVNVARDVVDNLERMVDCYVDQSDNKSNKSSVFANPSYENMRKFNVSQATLQEELHTHEGTCNKGLHHESNCKHSQNSNVECSEDCQIQEMRLKCVKELVQFLFLCTYSWTEKLRSVEPLSTLHFCLHHVNTLTNFVLKQTPLQQEPCQERKPKESLQLEESINKPLVETHQPSSNVVATHVKTPIKCRSLVEVLSRIKKLMYVLIAEQVSLFVENESTAIDSQLNTMPHKETLFEITMSSLCANAKIEGIDDHKSPLLLFRNLFELEQSSQEEKLSLKKLEEYKCEINNVTITSGSKEEVVNNNNANNNLLDLEHVRYTADYVVEEDSDTTSYDFEAINDDDTDEENDMKCPNENDNGKYTMTQNNVFVTRNTEQHEFVNVNTALQNNEQYESIQSTTSMSNNEVKKKKSNRKKKKKNKNENEKTEAMILTVEGEQIQSCCKENKNDVIYENNDHTDVEHTQQTAESEKEAKVVSATSDVSLVQDTACTVTTNQMIEPITILNNQHSTLHDNVVEYELKTQKPETCNYNSISNSNSNSNNNNSKSAMREYLQNMSYFKNEKKSERLEQIARMREVFQLICKYGKKDYNIIDYTFEKYKIEYRKRNQSECCVWVYAEILVNELDESDAMKSNESCNKNSEIQIKVINGESRRVRSVLMYMSNYYKDFLEARRNAILEVAWKLLPNELFVFTILCSVHVNDEICRFVSEKMRAYAPLTSPLPEKNILQHQQLSELQVSYEQYKTKCVTTNDYYNKNDNSASNNDSSISTDSYNKSIEERCSTKPPKCFAIESFMKVCFIEQALRLFSEQILPECNSNNNNDTNIEPITTTPTTTTTTTSEVFSEDVEECAKKNKTVLRTPLTFAWFVKQIYNTHCDRTDQYEYEVVITYTPTGEVCNMCRGNAFETDKVINDNINNNNNNNSSNSSSDQKETESCSLFCTIIRALARTAERVHVLPLFHKLCDEFFRTPCPVCPEIYNVLKYYLILAFNLRSFEKSMTKIATNITTIKEGASHNKESQDDTSTLFTQYLYGNSEVQVMLSMHLTQNEQWIAEPSCDVLLSMGAGSNKKHAREMCAKRFCVDNLFTVFTNVLEELEIKSNQFAQVNMAYETTKSEEVSSNNDDESQMKAAAVSTEISEKKKESNAKQLQVAK